MNLLPQSLTIDVDFRELIPSITEYNNNTIIQYDLGDRHLKIEIYNELLNISDTHRVIRNRAKRWAIGEL